MKRHVKQKSPAIGAIRIISGQWRGRKLPVLDAEGLRPTSDRTKETLFNWLAPYIVGRRCLDAYAGSGSLGFEALSRHAAHCTFVDIQQPAVAQIKRNLDMLNVGKDRANLIQGSVLQQTLAAGSVDLAFVDPPFHKGLVQPTLDFLLQQSLMAANSLIYVETEREAPAPMLPAPWRLLKSSESRQVCYRLYLLESADA